MSKLLSSLVHYSRLFQLIFVLGIGGTFQYGVQLSVLNSPSPFIKGFINETWLGRYGAPIAGDTLTLLWSLIVSVYSIGGFFGSLASGYLTGIYGKKTCLLWNSLIPVLASMLVACSKMAGSFEMILIARFLFGINAGFGFNVHSQYLGEISPKTLRGFTNTTSPLFVTIGKFCGQIIGLRELFGSEYMWPYVMATCGITSLFQLATLPFFPETPPYLLMEKQDEAGCMKAIQQLWGKGDHRAEIEDLKNEKIAMKKTKIMSVLELLRDRTMRWQLYVMLVLIATIQLSGVNAIYFYAYEVFREAGLAADQIPYIVLGAGACETIVTVVSGLLIERFGRRGLILTCYALMALALSLLTVTLSLQAWSSWIPYCSICFIFLFIMFFGLGPPGVTVSLCNEVFTQSSRSAALVIAGSLNWVALYVVGMIFPYVVDGLGQYCFLVFLVCIVATVIFSYFYLPETKGKSILEITEGFHKLNSPSKHIWSRRQEQAMCTRL